MALDWQVFCQDTIDKTVVAEGIETEEQMNLVRSQGCQEGQGYLFGKPMSATDIRARLDGPVVPLKRVRVA